MDGLDGLVGRADQFFDGRRRAVCCCVEPGCGSSSANNRPSHRIFIYPASLPTVLSPSLVGLDVISVGISVDLCTLPIAVLSLSRMRRILRAHCDS
ncbi:hypothetical protein BO71DRAFT_72278 [Aspergillus ellipticus CBS 707.79]|uniref:Uncharacterized protein n=1 Tax=Aspergillus ellipticus CBS 707.79 TaxID=1448320 RepID=A0A319D0T6_9EURO|nr:hypothetical protein BO71DRAFT_72278 [Aspergillus ellipticus CBS 707.79]